MQNEGNCKLARHKRPKKGSRHDSVVGIVGSATSEAPDASQPEAIAQPAEEITISGRALKKRENSPAGKRERAKHKRRSLFGYQMSRVLREEQAKDAKNRERRVSDPATAASNSSSSSNMIATSIQSAPMHSLQRKPEVASVPIEVLDVNNAEKQQRHVVMRDVAVSTNKPSVKAREEQKNTQCKEEQSDIELNATIDF
ncbi:hypothetical protein LPJ55_000119 [Coemansia sp. RSA 990]|nr:hypothetical protein LPJ55_000119 [Coemansia sp. RSA 990]